MSNDDVSNPEGEKPAGVLVQIYRVTKALASTVMGPSDSVPTESRQVRRGKFFLSNVDQSTYGSLKRPILEYRGHGVVVGQMEVDDERDGIWCFGTHPDFGMIPALMDIWDWPEYVRTATGWELKKSGEKHDWMEGLLTVASPTKRLT